MTPYEVGDQHCDELVQERRNSSAWAMELRLSCTNPSIGSGNGLSPYRRPHIVSRFAFIEIISGINKYKSPSTVTFPTWPISMSTLEWRHNGHHGVSNHQRLDCLLTCLFSASLAFVRGIHRGPVNSPHKRPVTREMSPFDDVIMNDGIQ